MPNNFGLFFTRDSTVIRLPVNPEKLPVEKTSDNSDYNVLGIGPIIVPRIPNLRIVTISSWFPGRPFSGVLTPSEFQPPEFYLQFFQSAMDDKVPILYTPVRYYENGEPFATGETGFQVIVTQFNAEERGGETGDFYYDLELTEYRDYSPQTMTVTSTAQSTENQTIPATVSPAREIPTGQLYVGAACIANGTYYASSYGALPSGTASGSTVLVSRIVDLSRPYPVHITTESGGALGWIEQSGLQVVSTA